MRKLLSAVWWCPAAGQTLHPAPVRHRPLSWDRNFQGSAKTNSVATRKPQPTHPSTAFFSRSMVLGKKEKGGDMGRVVDDKPGESQAGPKAAGKTKESGTVERP